MEVLEKKSSASDKVSESFFDKVWALIRRNDKKLATYIDNTEDGLSNITVSRESMVNPIWVSAFEIIENNLKNQIRINDGRVLILSEERSKIKPHAIKVVSNEFGFECEREVPANIKNAKHILDNQIRKILNENSKLKEKLVSFERCRKYQTKLIKKGFKDAVVIPIQIFEEACRCLDIFIFRHLDKNGVTPASGAKFRMIDSQKEKLEYLKYYFENNTDRKNPCFNDYDVDESWGHRETYYVKVEFPKPPCNFVHTLDLAKRRLSKPYFAAYFDAITFDLVVKLSNKIKPEIYNNCSTKYEGKTDPILFVEKSGMSAILAQYGDFPNEKALIEWAKTFVW